MFRCNKVLLLLPLACLLGLQLLTAQERYTRIVRISYSSGNVQLGGRDAMMNSPVTEGQALVTGSNGLAEVEFEDRSTLRLAPETQISFSQLARLDSGEALTRVVVDRGEIEFSLKHGSKGQAGQYVVNAHGKDIRFKSGTRVRVLSEDDNPLEIAVWNGEAVVNDPEAMHEVTIKKNKTFTLAINDPFLYEMEKGIEADDLDQFSQSRDQYLASLPSRGPGTSGLLTLFSGAGSPCYPNYWVPGSSLYCFDPFFPGYLPSTAGYVDIYPYYPRHHHHHHPPFIHPPSPTVAAKAVPVDKHVAPDFKRIDSRHAANWSASGTTKAARDGANPVHVSGNGFTQSRSNSSSNFSTHNSGSPSPHASSGGASPSYSGSGHSSASFSSGGSVSHSSGGSTSSGGSVSHSSGGSTSAGSASASSSGSAGRPH